VNSRGNAGAKQEWQRGSKMRKALSAWPRVPFKGGGNWWRELGASMRMAAAAI
jgi:hypothetical protein